MARKKDMGKRSKIIDVIDGLKNYWPLTLRQIYYRLVAAGEIENNRGSYQALSKILTELRIDGVVSWDSMEDRTRRTSGKRGFPDSQEFIKQETENFLAGYTRCRVQGQEKHVEVMIEKDAHIKDIRECCMALLYASHNLPGIRLHNESPTVCYESKGSYQTGANSGCSLLRRL